MLATTLIVDNAADNVLYGGMSADTMEGGLGNDTYLVDRSTGRVAEATNAGIDTVSTSA